MTTRAVPRVAWMLFGITLVAVGVVVAIRVQQHGHDWFFRTGDSVFYRNVAHHPFGDTLRFNGVAVPDGEGAYRYGRIGYPFIAYVFGGGHAAVIDWALIALHAVAIAAVPALAAVLCDAYGAPPAWGALTLFAPGLLLIVDRPQADPFLIALLLLVFVAEARGKRGGALVALAVAILVKEVAALAIIPFVWRALRKGDHRDAAAWTATLAPYIAWCVWVQLRFHDLPFLADTRSRRDALRAPFVGVGETLRNNTADRELIALLVIVTVVLAVWGFVVARPLPLAGATLAFGALAACIGPATTYHRVETFRVVALAQVFAIVALVIGLLGAHHRAAVPSENE